MLITKEILLRNPQKVFDFYVENLNENNKNQKVDNKVFCDKFFTNYLKVKPDFVKFILNNFNEDLFNDVSFTNSISIMNSCSDRGMELVIYNNFIEFYRKLVFNRGFTKKWLKPRSNDFVACIIRYFLTDKNLYIKNFITDSTNKSVAFIFICIIKKFLQDNCGKFFAQSEYSSQYFINKNQSQHNTLVDFKNLLVFDLFSKASINTNNELEFNFKLSEIISVYSNLQLRFFQVSNINTSAIEKRIKTNTQKLQCISEKIININYKNVQYLRDNVNKLTKKINNEESITKYFKNSKNLMDLHESINNSANKNIKKMLKRRKTCIDYISKYKNEIRKVEFVGGLELMLNHTNFYNNEYKAYKNLFDPPNKNYLIKLLLKPMIIDYIINKYENNDVEDDNQRDTILGIGKNSDAKLIGDVTLETFLKNGNISEYKKKLLSNTENINITIRGLYTDIINNKIENDQLMAFLDYPKAVVMTPIHEHSIGNGKLIILKNKYVTTLNSFNKENRSERFKILAQIIIHTLFSNSNNHNVLKNKNITFNALKRSNNITLDLEFIMEFVRVLSSDERNADFEAANKHEIENLISNIINQSEIKPVVDKKEYVEIEIDKKLNLNNSAKKVKLMVNNSMEFILNDIIGNGDKIAVEYNQIITNKGKLDKLFSGEDKILGFINEGSANDEQNNVNDEQNNVNDGQGEDKGENEVTKAMERNGEPTDYYYEFLLNKYDDVDDPNYNKFLKVFFKDINYFYDINYDSQDNTQNKNALLTLLKDMKSNIEAFYIIDTYFISLRNNNKKQLTNIDNSKLYNILNEVYSDDFQFKMITDIFEFIDSDDDISNESQLYAISRMNLSAKENIKKLFDIVLALYRGEMTAERCKNLDMDFLKDMDEKHKKNLDKIREKLNKICTDKLNSGRGSDTNTDTDRNTDTEFDTPINNPTPVNEVINKSEKTRQEDIHQLNKLSLDGIKNNLDYYISKIPLKSNTTNKNISNLYKFYIMDEPPFTDNLSDDLKYFFLQKILDKVPSKKLCEEYNKKGSVISHIITNENFYPQRDNKYGLMKNIFDEGGFEIDKCITNMDSGVESSGDESSFESSGDESSFDSSSVDESFDESSFDSSFDSNDDDSSSVDESTDDDSSTDDSTDDDSSVDDSDPNGPPGPAPAPIGIHHVRDISDVSTFTSHVNDSSATSSYYDPHRENNTPMQGIATPIHHRFNDFNDEGVDTYINNNKTLNSKVSRLEGISKKWAIGIIAGNIYKINKDSNLLSNSTNDKTKAISVFFKANNINIESSEIISHADEWFEINKKHNLISQSELDNLYQAYIGFT